MRVLLWLLTLGALSVGLALAALYNDGYVLLVLPPWRVELSLNLMILLQLAGFVVTYLFLRAVSHTLQLPQRVRVYRARRKREQAERALGDALRFSFEGRYGHALKSAASAHFAGYAQGISALLAARAAHAMRDDEREAEWLRRAIAHDGESRVARLMTEAELSLDAHRYADAQGVLDVLAATGQRHLAALRLSLRSKQALGDWRATLHLLRQLEKYRALSDEQAAPLKLRAHQEILHSLHLDAGALADYWKTIPRSDRRSPRLAAEAARLLIAAGDCLNAQHIIEDALDEEWDSSLLAIYAECRGGDVLGRIAQAEDWLKRQPRDAQLLLALGRLCHRQQLWGKAQSYLEASLSLQATRDVHVELAQLLDHLERPEDANHHYRAAALITT
ncbi:MAG TPA: heme biosynthesis HemY N-terminal domain-containing protein [Rhodocyclaceae bacterium]|jgi:HemY protein|nr:heme biosynthesis HemY N-terminal domain-containing protein [Rhodocyclaceae bacterium]